MASRVSLEVGDDGVGVIRIFNPPVNALALSVLVGIKEKYMEAMRRDDVKAIVLTGQSNAFSGGFDVRNFQEIHRTGDMSFLPEISVDLVCNTIEDAKKPSVVAISGQAIGGGLEISMGCHARIATPDAVLCLPELTVGIIPGYGGTQRLPRLVGLPKAIEMLLLSKPITAKEGKELGLIDAVVSSENLLRIARLWALDIADRCKPWMTSLRRTDKLCSVPEARKIIESVRQKMKVIAPNVPHHEACLDALEEGIVFGGHAGILKESRLIHNLIYTSTCKGLVHTFFAERAVSKVPNVTNIKLKPRPIRKAAVIGGGLMGSGIATALIQSDISVMLKEVSSDFLEKGMKAIAENLQGLFNKGSLTEDKMDKALSLLKGVLDYSEFGDVDMVIEAVVEDVQLKQSIFSEIEKVCSPHCILATNTSTIDLNIVGEKTSSQDRIVGAHFFSPAHLMPLLEIVRTEKTSAQVILDLMTVGRAINKIPVVVRNCTAFAVNRTFFPYTQGAQLLVSLGVDLYRIDRVLSEFGMPMGPFQLQDVTGYGVAVAINKMITSAFSGRSFESPLLDLMIADGRKGKANGKGYYMYEKGSKPKPDPSVQPIIQECIRLTNIMHGRKVNLSDQEILEMVLFPVVNEACRVLDEGVVVRASDLDIATVVGMSFPSYRGGIVFWADSVGPLYIYESLKKWEVEYGGFFKPSQYLEERASRDISLAQPAPPSTLDLDVLIASF
ncbi:Peroxisomal fatty acid beta-oxidation multifunctional protein [Acorus gramineus]|uniref:Peroxisomal fatty acid beta-oxidation multifunctional protein n=1 Tax=Acorus gramineus TaxID=55184 RepID=A0AAV9AK89_ACOGR|nr:Peroxisomal fatty acid beta-oxidation multifunctional protein [Acorus gramineus]